MQPTNQSSDAKLSLIESARNAIRGSRNLNLAQLKDLCKSLERNDQFAYATEILLIIMEEEQKAGNQVSLKMYQTLAKYIYKDHSLPSSFKFERALNELQTHDALLHTQRCETLGLAGAIYKRKWQYDHQFRNLVLSQYYYKKGFNYWKYFIDELKNGRTCNPDCNDDGYTAINYSFVTELMATDKLEELGDRTGITEGIIKNLEDAVAAREFILSQLCDGKGAIKSTYNLSENPWIIATVAETYFGLHKYDDAHKYIKQYLDVQESFPWEIRSFNQQMFSLAYLQSSQKKSAAKYHKGEKDAINKLAVTVEKINDNSIDTCLSLFNLKDNGSRKIEITKTGKTGLALSGGGFRASLFHIGVLASLAENDELRNVEVISCVSGGSIIGAFYYLKLKKLLETVHDDDIKRQHYIDIVKEIERDFLSGVQKNLRMRIFSNAVLNFKILFDKNYSRSHRIGELYECYFYKDLLGKDEIFMDDLFINPKLNDKETFSFSTDNWKRKNKIPQLVLNATSVNTGHNWQFTASWMGEPPGNIQADVDAKPRLRRMYYGEAPGNYNKFRLGYAVAASAGVPVMFEPMPMYDLYENVKLQLIDGGLHDNQGIAALIEQECNNMIISDASGQMATNETATLNLFGVFMRADLILQERLRELQFMDIKERNHTSQLNSLVKVHLKNGLTQFPVKWKHCMDPERTIVYDDDEIYSDSDLLPYGVLRNSQQLLSEIRTDLDSFNDVEAYSLMYSGYAQTDHEFVKKGRTPDRVNEWKFLQLREFLNKPAKEEQIKKVLSTGSKQAFKFLHASKTTKVIFILVGAALLSYLIYIAACQWNEPLFSITTRGLAIFLLFTLLGMFSKPLKAIIDFKGTGKKYLSMAAIITIGFFVCLFYLSLFNGIYNRSGSVKKL